MVRKHLYYGKNMSTNFSVSPHAMDFEKKHAYYGKNMSTSFPGSPLTMSFAEFSRAMGN